MGIILASAIVAEVRADLVDAGSVTWSDPDLLADLNEALRALCSLKVDSYVIREPVTLDAGEDQVLPSGGIAIFDMLANTVSGMPVTLVDQELLDEATRFSPVPAQTEDVQHWTADPRDKTRFRVYPPNDGTGSVVTVYGAVPDAIDSNDAIPVGDNNEPAIKCYMMGLAYRRNTQRQDLGKSQGYFQQFLTMLGLSANTQIAAAPKVDQSAGAN